MLEYCIREDLKMKRPRMMAVLDPVKVVIDNYPEGQVEQLPVDNNLENPELGQRTVPFTRELYIERDDFMEEPPKKYFRMFPGNEVFEKEVARILRYEAFEEEADRYPCETAYAADQKRGNSRQVVVAVAHHMEDNAETVLFQMLRGSGAKGLAGMHPVSVKNGVTYISAIVGMPNQFQFFIFIYEVFQ